MAFNCSLQNYSKNGTGNLALEIGRFFSFLQLWRPEQPTDHEENLKNPVPFFSLMSWACVRVKKPLQAERSQLKTMLG